MMRWGRGYNDVASLDWLAAASLIPIGSQTECLYGMESAKLAIARRSAAPPTPASRRAQLSVRLELVLSAA